MESKLNLVLIVLRLSRHSSDQDQSLIYGLQIRGDGKETGVRQHRSAGFLSSLNHIPSLKVEIKERFFFADCQKIYRPSMGFNCLKSD
jgi:hypothetical protein